MIANDNAILEHFIENWDKMLKDYVSKMEDKIISRKFLPTRNIGGDVMYDIVTRYDRTGAGAQIMSKGAVPKGSGVDATTETYMMYQLLDGFLIHEKDMKLDPKLKGRELEIILNNIHRAENILTLTGNTAHGMDGLADIVPAGNVWSAAEKWDRTGGAPEYYDDVLSAIALMDQDFEPRYLIGNRQDMLQLYWLSDDTKQPVYQQIAGLFGKNPTDPVSSWLIPCGNSTLPVGTAYVVPYDADAAELVISENPSLRAIPQQRGGNYPIEMYEWLNMEWHEPNAFCSIDTLQ